MQHLCIIQYAALVHLQFLRCCFISLNCGICGRYLIGSERRLSGTIPDLRNCTAIERWNGQQSSISGSVPSLNSTIKELRLYKTKLSGSLPQKMNLPLLELLWAGMNNISGSLPNQLDQQMPVLEYLDLKLARTSGSLPVAVANLSHLTRPNFNKNRLSGTLPDQWSKANQLILLSFSDNLLSGR